MRRPFYLFCSAEFIDVVFTFEMYWIPFLRRCSTFFIILRCPFYLFCSAEFLNTFFKVLQYLVLLFCGALFICSAAQNLLTLFSPLRCTDYLFLCCCSTSFYYSAVPFLFVLQRRIYCTTAHIFDVLQRTEVEGVGYCLRWIW